MPRGRPKKQEEPNQPKPSRSAAEVFAAQRRLTVLSKERGEKLIDELIAAGFKVSRRGDASLTMVTANFAQYVIDLTK